MQKKKEIRDLDLILDEPKNRMKDGSRQKNLNLILEEPDRKLVSKREQQRRRIRNKKRRRKQRIARIVTGTAAIMLLALLLYGFWTLGSYIRKKEEKQTWNADKQAEQILIDNNQSPKPEMTEDFLTPNEYSRPGEELTEVTELFVHYTANRGTTAAQNRSYFENLGITGETSASAHFVIGYDGEIIQCLPLSEIGYAVKEHNYNSISIECCYLDESGKFTDATYQSLIKLLGWLMCKYDLGPSDVKRHYDTCGKLCPVYYVENEEAWEQLKSDLTDYIEGDGQPE